MPIFRLTHEIAFPPVEAAETGLLAVGGDLQRKRLLLAYRSGIFPWYSEGEPLLWWAPDPRMVLLPEEFHCARSLQRVIKKKIFEVTLNRAFPDVIRACGATPRPGQDGTWITPDMEDAYIDLHEAGYAMSIECWAEDKLVGGLYGVALGSCFFGESMFSHQSNASKVAAHALVTAAQDWGLSLIDCQVANPHLERLGAREISRAAFMKRLEAGLRKTRAPHAWKRLPDGV